MKKFILFFLTFITCLFLIPNDYVVANAETSVSDNVIINQSVDDDLAEFNFDYERYCVDEDKFYQPIMINYRESLSSEYYDLVYFYNLHSFSTPYYLKINIYVGDNVDSLTKIKSENYRLYQAGSNENNIYRFALNAFDTYRNEYKYRLYEIVSVSCRFFETEKYMSYELNNLYQFEKNNTYYSYSNCMNVILEDAHCWSWHFDEDNDWDNFWEWVGGNRSDVLKDQLFYSFYISNWDVSEIKSIDLQYKKVLLDGWRHNVADIGNESEFYDNAEDPDGFAPKFYKWNDNNTKDSLDKSNLLGYSKSSIANKISYTSKTITPTSKTSVGVEHDYTWDTILNINEFKTQFGEDSNIYDFASGYFTSKENQDNYWIINFDEFYYTYLKNNVLTSYESYSIFEEYNLEFNDYLKEHNVNVDYYNASSEAPVYYGRRECYSFTQEYVFDMRALKMTFEDSNKVEHTLPTSVAPVDEEASGGGSEFFLLDISEDWWKELLRIIAVIFLVLVLIFFWPFIKIALDAIVLAFKAVINFFKQLFSKKEKKDERKDE